MSILLSEQYQALEQECEARFRKLKANEEELNQIFISAYGMETILTPEVPEKSISVRRAELRREIKSLINYAVGCLFGRYSPDHEGLCYAGGIWNPEYYQRIIPTEDNLIFLSEEIFPERCLLTGIENFLRIICGEESFQENLAFMASALNDQGEPEEILKKYLHQEFYIDHHKFYRKRPVYWLLDSGKKHAFQALLYIHRWKPSLPEHIRRDCLPEYRKFYQHRLDQADTSKKQKKYTAILEELESYDQKLESISGLILNPDDGILNNYQKLELILKKLIF